jgi:hypothetical protein
LIDRHHAIHIFLVRRLRPPVYQGLLAASMQYKGWDAYRDDYKAFFDQYDGPIEFEFRDPVIAAGETFGYSHELQRVSGTAVRRWHFGCG